MNFLYNIAKDLLQRHGSDLHDVTIVFPNKRASLFLSNALVEQCGKPLWAPRYYTVSELFRSMTTLQIADHIKLVCELHKSYCKVTGKDETLDQFYSWGELMLADFDDIDKHLGDARQIFTLLSNIHELDSVDYLTPDKVEVLKSFFRNFTQDHTTILKQRFLELWNKFYDIYTDYRQSLLSQGIAYEGMLYREVVEDNENDNENPSPSLQCHCRETASNDTLSYYYVGFNLLTPVEERLIAMTGGKVCYDNDNSCPPKDVYIISSPTDDLQARYVSQWLTPKRIEAGRKTAIVLADESLLETVLHCLPDGIRLNITAGYPLTQASITSLVKAVIDLMQRGSYTLHNINGILRHPLVKHISPRAAELHSKLNKDLIYYLTPEDISIDDNLRQLFAPLSNKDDAAELTERLIWVTKTIAVEIQKIKHESQQEGNLQLESESLYRTYTLLCRLRTLLTEDDIHLTLPLYIRLLNQIISGTTIPFHGEPLEGIQIMGVLETRNLDFDHVLLLSCNEGNMPAHTSDTSFLPHSIRHAHGLTTIENKVGIYRYYFDRLLQRAHDVTILYNNSTTDGKTGEMSRFMLQLIAGGSTSPIHRHSLETTVGVRRGTGAETAKTPEMVKELLRKVSGPAVTPDAQGYLSPSALGKYLRCPMNFYYTYVEGIRDEEESDEEELDNRTFGNIFHCAAEMLYKDFEGKNVPSDYMQRLLNEKGHPTLHRIAEQAFRRELFHLEHSTRRTPKMGGLQIINFEIVVTFLLYLLRYDLTLTRPHIVALEQKFTGTIPVTTPEGKVEVRIGGKIDRLDMVTDQKGVRRLRVIDYKTGRLSSQSGMKLALPSIEAIFQPQKISSHSDYFLQALLYAAILSDRQSCPSAEWADMPIATGLLYVQHATAEDYDPLLRIGKSPIDDASEHLAEFTERLSALIAEILNPEIPFRRADNTEQCKNCHLFHFCH